MIEPMKKLSLLLYHQEKEPFLQSLRDLGVVHVVENPEVTSGDLQSARAALRTYERTLGALKRVQRELDSENPQREDRDVDDIVGEYEKLRDRKESLAQSIAAEKKNVATLAPWGDFDPQRIEALEAVGIKVRFFAASPKKFAALDMSKVSAEVISKTSGGVYFVVFQHEEEIELDAEEQILPQTSLSAAQEAIEEYRNESEQVDKSLAELTSYTDLLESYTRTKQSEARYESVRISMEEAAAGRVLSLTGWLPTRLEKKVAEFLDGYPAWYEITEPVTDDDVPVALQNPKQIKLFEPVTKIFSLPWYFEVDPTPFFGPFFALFFGLCLSDMGYGLVVTALGLVGLKVAPKALRLPMMLLAVLGFSTMLGGFLLNTVFGHAIFSPPGAEAGFLDQGAAAALLRPTETASGSMYFPAIPLSVYLGVMQIMLAIVLKAFNRARLNGIVYAFHPVGDLLMVAGVALLMANINFLDMGVFTFGAIALGPWLSGLPMSFAWALAAMGCLVMFVFNNPDKKAAARFGLGFWELYQFGTGLMADGLSYLRLFALGLGTGLLGSAFNQIAFMLITAEDGTRNYLSLPVIGTVLILLGGHGINLALSGLGSFVHPLRLTFVEFYKNLDFKGGAQAYSPFGKH